MPNNNYVRGRQSEYRAIKDLKKMGYYWCTRSPASKGLFDVTGIGVLGGIALQIKRTKRKRLVPSMYKADFQAIQEFIDAQEHIPEFIRFEFWIHREGVRGWTKYLFQKGKEPILIEGGVD